MKDRGKPQSAAEKNAQSYFKKAEQDESTAKKEYKKAFAANATKTANLREQRLAKEAADAAELTDSKLADSKLADSKLADSKLADRKLADRKLADSTPGDTKKTD
jgi:hypothetical protein